MGKTEEYYEMLTWRVLAHPTTRGWFLLGFIFGCAKLIYYGTEESLLDMITFSIPIFIHIFAAFYVHKRERSKVG